MARNGLKYKLMT